MNEKEFVSKLIKDKKFVEEAASHIPEDALRQMAEITRAESDKEVTAESDHSAMAEMMAGYFLPAAQAMGYSIDPAAFKAEALSALDSTGFIARMKFGIRLAKAIGQANEKYGIQG